MKNAAPALLALLLMLSLPAMTAVVAGSTPEENETTNRLELEGEVRSGHVDTGLDFGTSLAVQDDAMRTDYDTFAVEHHFDELSNDERRDAIDAAYDRVQQRIDDLEERERTTVRRHANGEIPDAELASVVVRNYNEAADLRESLSRLEARADRVPDYSIDTDDERGSLGVYRGPVRADLDAALRSGTPTAAVVVDTSPTGYRLSTVDGGTYVREATRFDHRDTTEPDQFGGFVDSSDAAERYPWAYDQPVNYGLRSITAFSTTQLYQIRFTTVQGDLDAYLDGGTGQVHHEVQELAVEELPSTPEAGRWTNDSLGLSINRTPANGPIQATVADTETDEPVQGVVFVDGHEVGETDADGTVWVAPPASNFDLTVQTSEGSVSANVSAR